MMASIDQWLIDINKNSHILYGAVTVITMSGLGVLIALFIEGLFKVFGIKGERIESHH
ncbi:MAG TPA: hypothetical protein VK654_13540 [Nitrospirota bacterium]|nr:hypothetical protein [Nitrospirota bacterium]